MGYWNKESEAVSSNVENKDTTGSVTASRSFIDIVIVVGINEDMRFLSLYSEPTRSQ